MVIEEMVNGNSSLVTGHWSLGVAGFGREQRAEGKEFWLLATGFLISYSLFLISFHSRIGRRAEGKGQGAKSSGFRVQGSEVGDQEKVDMVVVEAGCWILDTGYWAAIIYHFYLSFIIGCWSLVIGQVVMVTIDD